MLQGSTAFAVSLYRRLAVRNGNLLVSPQSISTALAMVAAGARGETLAELEAVLNLPLAKEAAAGEDPYELVSANALWASGQIELSAAYVSLLRREFGAPLEGLDFEHDAEGARRKINDWVAGVTRQKITELIGRGGLQPDTLLVLTNAIYMKAAWENPFLVRMTKAKIPFTAAGGETAHVAMMEQIGTFGFLHERGLRVLELPYRGKATSLLLVLPDAIDGLGELEGALTEQLIAKWRAGMRRQKVKVSLPRFKVESSLRLVPVLQAMGIRLVFERSGRADFSGISHSQLLAVSEVIQRAYVDVSEEGTEAAAAMAVTDVKRARWSRSVEIETFRADHPFLFAILRRGSVLFMGRLTNPGS